MAELAGKLIFWHRFHINFLLHLLIYLYLRIFFLSIFLLIENFHFLDGLYFFSHELLNKGCQLDKFTTNLSRTENSATNSNHI